MIKKSQISKKNWHFQNFEFWHFPNFGILKSEIFENVNFFSKSEIFWSKKKLTSKFLFFPKTYQMCSILTKYECITWSTPKVMLIFRFFRCWFFNFSFNSPPEANPQCKKQRVFWEIRFPFFWLTSWVWASVAFCSGGVRRKTRYLEISAWSRDHVFRGFSCIRATPRTLEPDT